MVQSQQKRKAKRPPTKMSVRSRLAQRGRRNGSQPHFRRRIPVGMPALTRLVLSGAAVATGLAHSCWGTFRALRGKLSGGGTSSRAPNQWLSRARRTNARGIANARRMYSRACFAFCQPPLACWRCPRNAVQCMCDVLVSGLRVDSREGAGGVLSSSESASDGALLPLRGVSSYSNKRMDFLESIRSPGPLLPVPKVPKKRS